MADDNTADNEMDKLLGALDEGGESSDSVIAGLADEASKTTSPVIESGIKAEEKTEGVAETAKVDTGAKVEEPAPVVTKTTEDRKRVYLHDDLPLHRKAEIQILADNPDMPIEQVKDLVAKKLEGINSDPDEQELSTAELAQASKERLKEVNEMLLEKERDFKHDDEWETLMKEKDQLLVDVPLLESEARSQEAGQRSLLARVEQSEARAATILPGLNDETSENYALVAGRVAQLIAIKDGGKELPVIEVDGVKQTLDPDSPDFPVLVATEIASKTRKTTTFVAQPEVTEQRPAVTRQLVSTPAASPVSAAQKHKPEGADARVSLKEKAAAVKSDDDLKALLDEDTGAWGGSSRFSKRVL